MSKTTRDQGCGRQGPAVDWRVRAPHAGTAPRRPIRPRARHSPAALPPPPATGQRPRPPGTAHLGCPTGTTAPPPPRLEGYRHGGRERRHERRGNPRTRPPSGRPLGPGRHACLSHCPPARYAAPGPPPQSTPRPGTAGPVASRLSIYSPTPLGGGNGGHPVKCTKSCPGGPLNHVGGPCTTFYPYKVGHRFGPKVYLERTWSPFGPSHATFLVGFGCVQNLASMEGAPAELGGVPNRPANWPVWVCPEPAHRQLANWPIWMSPQNHPPAGQLADLRVSQTTRPTGQSAGPSATSRQGAPCELASALGSQNPPQPGGRPKSLASTGE